MSSLPPHLERWSRAERDPTVDATIVEMFSRRAAAQPNAAAIEADGRAISFEQLFTTSQRVAVGLRRRGVGRGDLIGVFCQRTPNLVAVILGIWRCGAVYVPLDPKYPSQRLQAILTDVAPRLVVCDAPLPQRMEAADAATCDAAELCATLVAQVDSLADSSATLDDRAVVLYTSGSTGTPKGAVLTHRNLANHNAYVIRAFDLGPSDRRTAVCSINFDASLEEFFCTLNAGATLVLPQADTLDSLDRFLRFLESNRITALFMPTSLWRETTNFLYAAKREFPPTLRLIDIGGERVTRPIYERFLQVGGRRIRWINVYGPTECSIYATTYEHDPERDAARTEPPPIGRPIDNVLLFVIGEEGRLCAPGEAGELYIGGVGVGEGYLNRPDMTAERYVERPSSELPPGRYYRTGDQVRFRDDGQLEYLGRLDDQVKLRGFRIEPGEIEAALQRHPCVRDAVVAVRTSTLGTPYLAAYLVLHEGAVWDARSLTDFCRDRLPEYMVPRAFVQLDALPQSPNGKIDRAALLEPFFDEPQHDLIIGINDARSPTELEQQLLEVWRDALELCELELHDDFFALGGDSLRAMTLVAKLEAALQRPVPATMLLTAPTVAQLAVELEKKRDEADDSLLLMREGDDSRPLFFVHSLGGDVWIYRELVQRLQTDATIYGLQLPGLNGHASADDDLEVLAAEYVRRIQTVQPEGPYRLAGYSSGGMLAYAMARRLTEIGETIEFLGLIDAGVPPAYEHRLTGTRRQRLLALVRNVPLLAGELRAAGWNGAWRKVRRVLLSGCRKIAGRLRPTVARSKQSDGDVHACFAEDISFFSERRLQQIKQHYGAVYRYEPGPWSGAAQLFRVARQPLSAVPTPTLGWEHLIDGPVAVYDVSGTHATLMQVPHVDGLAAVFDAALAGAAANDLVPPTPVATAI